MQIIREPIRWKINKEVFLALGSFDGVHRGHRRLITNAVDGAQKAGAVSAVFTLDPHPLQVLAPQKAPLLLAQSHKKQEIISRLGVECFLCQEFNTEFAQTAPDDFVRRFFVDSIPVSRIYVGHDYRFGADGSGDTALLERLGQQYGFEVEVLAPVKYRGQVVSSTHIRRLVNRGKLAEAAAFLERPFSISGPIVPGQKRGRILGFPTANLKWPKRIVVPGRGVYAVRTDIKGRLLNGIANVGYSPTFVNSDREGELSLEVHIFDFKGQLYGQEVEVYFLQRIRGEKDFGCQQHLVRQIEKDILAAQDILSEHGGVAEL